jgi:hypothetical protein
MSDPKPWPPASGLTTKIVPRTSAILQLSHSTTIHAPASLVFNTLLNTTEYPKWNTWIPSVQIIAQPEPSSNDDGHMRIGTSMDFSVIMDASKPEKKTSTPLKVVDICTPEAPTDYLSPEMLADPMFTADLSKVYRVSWTGRGGGVMAWAMQLERFHEVIMRGEDECEVRTWEVMGGVLTRVVKMMYEKTLEEKLGLWCADLKKYCEEKHGKFNEA